MFKTYPSLPRKRKSITTTVQNRDVEIDASFQGSDRSFINTTLPRYSQKGVTLVELIIVIVVISVGLIGIFSVVNHTSRHSADPMLQQQSIMIAQSIMDEIYGKRLVNSTGNAPCNSPGGIRANWDNICDYNGYGGVDGVSIRDIDNNVIVGLENYRVKVNIDTSATLNGLTGPTTVLRIDVKVNHTSMGLLSDATSPLIFISAYRT